MLSADVIQRLVLERKCLRSTRELGDDEHVISRRSFPCLFRGEYDSEEATFIKLVFAKIEEVVSALTSEGRDSVRHFMQDVLRNGKVHNEEFLHRYLYEFWSNSWLEYLGSNQLVEKFYKCRVSPAASAFAKGIIPRLYQSGEHIPDIVGISGDKSRFVYVIEIKNEPLDDRALGQILRYYQVVRSVCDRFTIYGSTKRVVPVLIVPDGRISFWDSLPYHFREVLEILYWRLAHDGSIEIVDGKAVLRQMSSGRLFASH